MSSITSAIPDAPAAPQGADTRVALLRLGLVDGFRGAALRRLVDAFGDLDSVCRQPWRRLAEALPPALGQVLRAGLPAELETGALAWSAQPGQRLLTLADGDYPALLRTLADPPPLLWLKGDPGLLAHPALAVVGSRSATPRGLQDARAFAQHLGAAGLTIVSGLAEGIDGAAHEGALETLGRTVAVLAHGLDRIYPPMHRKLAHRIAAGGLLVSEYPLGTAALRPHFPERNRLISGLSLGVLVVEATLGSGSLITARHALEQGREVMAVPGSIHSPLSKGCHRLIRDGATLVESVQDVWAQLAGALGAVQGLPGPAGLAAEPLVERDPVLRMLQAGPAGVDEIERAIGLTAAQVSSILGREEVAGRITRLPDGRYQWLAASANNGSRPDRDS